MARYKPLNPKWFRTTQSVASRAASGAGRFWRYFTLFCLTNSMTWVANGTILAARSHQGKGDDTGTNFLSANTTGFVFLYANVVQLHIVRIFGNAEQFERPLYRFWWVCECMFRRCKHKLVCTTKNYKVEASVAHHLAVLVHISWNSDSKSSERLHSLS